MKHYEAHGKRLIVQRCSNTWREYCAYIVGSKHTRFGTRKEIAQDVAHFVTYGTLPHQVSR